MAYKDPHDLASIEKARKSRRDWYYRNKERQAEYKKRRDEEIREWFLEMRSTLVCERCGEDHPAVLEFHHSDRTQKDLAVSHAVYTYGWSIERIKEEIAKCEVLCKNCHAIFHWEEREHIG